ncbi:MAG: glycosyltransferase family 2 protein, partial [Rickettsiales bacterium]|nr:glycosyltransferase family 2 protein [Rickettsiales bacterium]
MIKTPPLISVLIPVYNAENFLKKCLDSVLQQTYKNLKIICIDDASTDKSLDVLKQYAKKDYRIKIVVMKKNLGENLIRRECIKHIDGEYF